MSIIEGPPSLDLTSCNVYFDPMNLKSYSGSGTVVTNLVNISDTGTLVGSPTFATNSFIYGASKYINIGITGLTSVTTMMAWVKLSAIGTEQPIFCYGSGIGTTARQLSISTAGKFDFNGFNSSQVSTTTLATNTWYHITGTYDGTTASTYVNGIFETSGATSWTLSLNNGYIGRDLDLITAKYATTSQIGAVMQFSTVLSATSISNIFNAQRFKYGV